MFGAQKISPGHESGALQSITQTPCTQVPFVQPIAHSEAASGGVLVFASASGFASSLGPPPQGTSGAAHQPCAPHTWPPPQSAAPVHETVQSRNDGE
jgi:hypothetical protein